MHGIRPSQPITREFLRKVGALFYLNFGKNVLYRMWLSSVQQWLCIRNCDGDWFTQTEPVSGVKAAIRSTDDRAKQTFITNLGPDKAVICEGEIAVAVLDPNSWLLLKTPGKLKLSAFAITGASETPSAMLTVSTNRSCLCGRTEYISSQFYTAQCDPGLTGGIATRYASAVSLISQANADQKALSVAQELAQAAITCESPECNEESVIRIVYDWSGTGSRDLDTGTTFLGDSVGYACGGGNDYMQWDGDSTTLNSTEEVRILACAANKAGLWQSSVQIQLCAGWYAPAGGTGNVDLTVTYNNVTKTKTVAPGSQAGCSSTQVAIVTVYDNGSFDLT